MRRAAALPDAGFLPGWETGEEQLAGAEVLKRRICRYPDLPAKFNEEARRLLRERGRVSAEMVVQSLKKSDPNLTVCNEARTLMAYWAQATIPELRRAFGCRNSKFKALPPTFFQSTP